MSNNIADRGEEFKSMSRAAKRTITSVTLQNVADQYDIYLPTIALAGAMSYFEPEYLTDSVSTTVYYVVFVISLLGRPLGSILVGWVADIIGRRKALAGAIIGYSMTTLLIGLLPGFTSWGYASLGLLLFLRFVDGVLLGGGGTTANTLAIEAAPQRLRGLVGGITASAFTIANWLIAFVTTMLLASMTREQYTVWGWRIPFYLGAILSLGVLVHFLTKVPESDLWAQGYRRVSGQNRDDTGSRERTRPLRELVIDREHRRVLTQTFVLMSGYWLTVNLVFTTLSPSLQHIGFSYADSSKILLIAYVPLFFAYVSAGAFSQWFGRRRTFILSGLVIATAVPALYYLMIVQHASFTASTLITAVLLCISLGIIAPTQAAYLNERFPTEVRGIGYGAAYTMAMIIPAFYSFFIEAIATIVVPYEYAHLPLIVLAGGLIAAGAAMGPETRDTNFSVQRSIQADSPGI